MKLYLAAIPALLLCACATTPPPAPACALPQPPAMPEVGSVDPITVELGRKFDAQAFRCSNDLECLQKLSGACPNGYSSSRPLMAGANKQVGVLFRCISDKDLAEAKAEEARIAKEEALREAEWKAEADARRAAAEALKKQAKPKK